MFTNWNFVNIRTFVVTLTWYPKLHYGLSFRDLVTSRSNAWLFKNSNLPVNQIKRDKPFSIIRQIPNRLPKELLIRSRWVVYQGSVTTFTKFQLVNTIVQFWYYLLHLPDIRTVWISVDSKAVQTQAADRTFLFK